MGRMEQGEEHRVTAGTTDRYSVLEERVNILSHGFGILMSIAALVLLTVSAAQGSPLRIVSFILFGLGLLTLYTASTLYHASPEGSVRRRRLKVFDHAAIYLLIAGSYTPFTLVTLQGTLGWVIFSLSWAAAFIGITLKLFFTGRFRLLSTVMYVLMGWLIILFIKPLIASFSEGGLFWLFAGGAAYTVGAVLYLIKRIPGNHALFHLLVLAGSFCHIMAVLRYV